MSEYENKEINEETEETEKSEEITEQASEKTEEATEEKKEESEEEKRQEDYRAPEKKRNMGARRIFTAVVLVLVVALSARIGYILALDRDSGNDMTENKPAVTTAKNGEGTFTPPTTTVVMQQSQSPAVSADVGTYVYVNQKASPSVVSIVTEAISYNVFYGNYVESGAGSGVIIAQSENTYYILTNNHVVDGYSNIIVYTAGNTSEKGLTATVVGTDWTNDIAVIKVESEEPLTVAEPATSASVVTGQNVAAIGNPLGKFSGTITPGIISSSSREVEIEGVNMELLQHSASVSPGNSGGGLFNMQGQLIGIVNAKSSGTGVEGIGFAIPIDTAIRVAGDIINLGYATGIPHLGITFTSSNLYVAEYKYNDELTSSGQQTIQANDILVAIDGVNVSNIEATRSVLSRKEIGDKVKLKLMRIVQTDGYRSTYESYEVEVVIHEYTPVTAK